MRVLYVNHTAEVSGAERSLLTLLSALPAAIEPHVAAPEGRLSEAVRQLGVPVVTIAGTAGSLRLHPLHTPRALVELGAAALQVHGAARRLRVDVVHANSIRAGIVASLGAPARAARIVHVRDCLPRGVVSDLTLRLIGARADRVIANSRHTAASVRAAAPGAHVEVLYNPVDMQRFDPARIDRASARSALGVAGESSLLMGVVAQITPWKGQETAIEALRLLRGRGVDAHLLLIGSAKFVAKATRFDNRGYVETLKANVAAAGLSERVWWLGEREDVPELMRALDVLMLPSWEEPFGRAMAEAMALEVPVIATSVGGPAEILADGRAGLLADPHDPAAWAEALAGLAADPARMAQMGRCGRTQALRQLTPQEHARRLCELYGAAR